MANPVEIIGQSSRRIARLAAIRTLMAALGPAFAAIAIGLLLAQIGNLTWTRYGYALAPDREHALRIIFILCGIAALLAGVALAYRAYRRSDDFIATAAELDIRLAGKEQITTLASLANPAAVDVPAIVPAAAAISVVIPEAVEVPATRPTVAATSVATPATTEVPADEP